GVGPGRFSVVGVRTDRAVPTHRHPQPVPVVVAVSAPVQPLAAHPPAADPPAGSERPGAAAAGPPGPGPPGSTAAAAGAAGADPALAGALVPAAAPPGPGDRRPGHGSRGGAGAGAGADRPPRRAATGLPVDLPHHPLVEHPPHHPGPTHPPRGDPPGRTSGMITGRYGGAVEPTLLARAPLDPDALRRPVLRPARLWRRVVVLAETDSTMAEVVKAAWDGEPEGLVVVAEHQRAGRGRIGRRWSCPPRAGLTLSVLLRPAESTPGRPPAPVPQWGWL